MPSRNQRSQLRLGKSMTGVGARWEEGHGQANRTIEDTSKGFDHEVIDFGEIMGDSGGTEWIHPDFFFNMSFVLE